MAITNIQSGTTVYKVAERIYRINTPVVMKVFQISSTCYANEKYLELT
jgi:hypothetical protein